MDSRLHASLLAPLAALTLAGAASAQSISIPSVVITVENAQPNRGTFLTPPWIGIHDGTFDTYDGGMPANVPLGGNEIEALAEDGNNGPLTATFELLQPGAPQRQGVVSPTGPLAPGQRVSVNLQVDPSTNRYFSYASMVIPSNDAFIANGNPLAHQLFDANGAFTGRSFIVSGDETNDAGTEVNDEIASNVAFLAQAAPNTGVTEFEPVTTPSPGFAAPGSLAYPDGVLNYEAFALGDFNDPEDRLFRVAFRYVDLGSVLSFRSILTPEQEIQPDVVDSVARGVMQVRSRNGDELRFRGRIRNLTGPIQMAHLHLGAAGSNGPVVVDLGGFVNGEFLTGSIGAADLVGPLAGTDFADFLGEVAAGNVYFNIHTTEYPAGEVRGQITLLN